MSDEKTTAAAAEKPKRTEEERALALHEASTEIERVIAENGLIAIAALSPLEQSIKLSKGVTALRKVLSEGVMKEFFMPIQGTRLGFQTDKDKDGGYDLATVREVLIEAFMRGFRPIGNELNVIAGQFYGAKNGYERIVREYPGLTDLRVELSVPEDAPKGNSLVSAHAVWFLNGVQDELWCAVPDPAVGRKLDTRIPVRVNAGMGPDAVLGKATRKLYARIYAILTNTSQSEAEADPDDARRTIVTEGTTPQVEASPEQRRMSFKKNGGAAPAPATAAEPEQKPMRQPGED